MTVSTSATEYYKQRYKELPDNLGPIEGKKVNVAWMKVKGLRYGGEDGAGYYWVNRNGKVYRFEDLPTDRASDSGWDNDTEDEDPRFDFGSNVTMPGTPGAALPGGNRAPARTGYMANPLVKQHSSAVTYTDVDWVNPRALRNALITKSVRDRSSGIADSSSVTGKHKDKDSDGSLPGTRSAKDKASGKKHDCDCDGKSEKGGAGGGAGEKDTDKDKTGNNSGGAGGGGGTGGGGTGSGSGEGSSSGGAGGNTSGSGSGAGSGDGSNGSGSGGGTTGGAGSGSGEGGGGSSSGGGSNGSSSGDGGGGSATDTKGKVTDKSATTKEDKDKVKDGDTTDGGGGAAKDKTDTKGPNEKDKQKAIDKANEILKARQAQYRKDQTTENKDKLWDGIDDKKTVKTTYTDPDTGKRYTFDMKYDQATGQWGEVPGTTRPAYEGDSNDGWGGPDTKNVNREKGDTAKYTYIFDVYNPYGGNTIDSTLTQAGEPGSSSGTDSTTTGTTPTGTDNTKVTPAPGDKTKKDDHSKDTTTTPAGKDTKKESGDNSSSTTAKHDCKCDDGADSSSTDTSTSATSTTKTTASKEKVTDKEVKDKIPDKKTVTPAKKRKIPFVVDLSNPTDKNMYYMQPINAHPRVFYKEVEEEEDEVVKPLPSPIKEIKPTPIHSPIMPIVVKKHPQYRFIDTPSDAFEMIEPFEPKDNTVIPPPDENAFNVYVVQDEETFKDNSFDRNIVMKTIKDIYDKSDLVRCIDAKKTSIKFHFIKDPKLGIPWYRKWKKNDFPRNVQVINLQTINNDEFPMCDQPGQTQLYRNDYRYGGWEWVSIPVAKKICQQWNTFNIKDLSYTIGYNAAHEILHNLLDNAIAYFFRSGDWTDFEILSMIGYDFRDENGWHLSYSPNLLESSDKRDDIANRSSKSIAYERILPEISYLICAFLRNYKKYDDFKMFRNWKDGLKALERNYKKIKEETKK